MNLLARLTEAKKTFSIIELGCGIPVAHSFMQQSGASKVITMACCPYNKDYQAEMTGLDLAVTRSVSLEVVQELLQNLRDVAKGESFHVAYSIQAGMSAKICHGYIGISDGLSVVIYHITLGKDIGKQKAGMYMIALVDDLIKYHIFGERRTLCNSDDISLIDGAWSTPNVALTGLTFSASLLPDNFGTFCWAAGAWHRVVDIYRQLEGGLCIIKGSFNPMHDGHKQLVEAAKAHTNLPLLCMTTKSIDGKRATAAELIQRAIDSGNACVIDSHNVYMRELIDDLSQWDHTTRTLHLFMGIDVFLKFDPTDVDETVRVHVYHRNCTMNNISFHDSKYATLSSTAIREAK